MNGPKNILVRAPNFLGDHILALPFYRQLRAHYPQSSLTLLGPEFVESFLDPAWGFSFRPLHMPGGGRIDSRSLARTLREDNFDVAFSLVASFSSAWLLWLSGIPHRIGFAEGIALPFLTHSVRWKGRGGGLHKSELYLTLLAEIGAEVVSPPVPLARTAAQSAGGSYVVVAPGASLPLREWPYYWELIRWLRQNYPLLKVMVVGGPAEAVWHKRLARFADPGVEDKVGQTDLSELARLMGEARLVIANDSGPAHVAATVANVPTVVLFGPGDPAYIRPRGSRVTVVRRSDLPCSPCESAVCRIADKKACLNGLSLEEVVQSLDLIPLGGKNLSA